MAIPSSDGSGPKKRPGAPDAGIFVPLQTGSPGLYGAV